MNQQIEVHVLKSVVDSVKEREKGAKKKERRVAIKVNLGELSIVQNEDTGER